MGLLENLRAHQKGAEGQGWMGQGYATSGEFLSHSDGEEQRRRSSDGKTEGAGVGGILIEVGLIVWLTQPPSLLVAVIFYLLLCPIYLIALLKIRAAKWITLLGFSAWSFWYISAFDSSNSKYIFWLCFVGLMLFDRLLISLLSEEFNFLKFSLLAALCVGTSAFSLSPTSSLITFLKQKENYFETGCTKFPGDKTYQARTFSGGRLISKSYNKDDLKVFPDNAGDGKDYVRYNGTYFVTGTCPGSVVSLKGVLPGDAYTLGSNLRWEPESGDLPSELIASKTGIHAPSEPIPAPNIPSQPRSFPELKKWCTDVADLRYNGDVNFIASCGKTLHRKLFPNVGVVYRGNHKYFVDN